jgi:hypothetical protein
MQALVQIDHYRIDVESDSTVRADLTQKRGEMAEFLNGTAQFFNTMAPLIQQAPTVAGPIVDLYAAFARQFSLGKQAEDALDQLTEMAKEAQGQQQGQPGPDPVEMEKVKIQKQKVDQDGQKAVADFQLRTRQQQHQESKDVAELRLEAQQQRAVAIGPT